MSRNLTLALLVITNAFDAVFTDRLLSLELIEELNPFMRWLHECSPAYFYSYKVFSTTLAVYVIGTMWDSPLVRYLAYVLTGLYSLLTVYSCLAFLTL